MVNSFLLTMYWCSCNDYLNWLKVKSNEYTDLMNASTAAAFHKHEELSSDKSEVAGYKYRAGIFPEYFKLRWRFIYLCFQVLTLLVTMYF